MSLLTLALTSPVLALATSIAPQGPELVADINQSGEPVSGIPNDDRALILENQGHLTLVGSTQATGIELFGFTPGAAPSLLRDIRPGVKDSDPELGVVLAGFVYFTANNGFGRELWRSNGTPEGTRLFSHVGSLPTVPEQLVTDGTRLFATVLDGPAQARERRLVTFDLQSGQATFLTAFDGPSAIDEPREATPNGAGLLVFSGEVGALGRELCVTAGQAGDGALVLDINPGMAGSDPREFTPYAGHVYFSALRNGDRELWRTDGTAAGTSLVSTIWPAAQVATHGVGEIATNGQELVFTRHTPATGAEIWALNGGSPIVLTDRSLPGEDIFPVQLYMDGNAIYFTMQAPLGTFVPLLRKPWRATTTPLTEVALTDLQLNYFSNTEVFVFHAGRAYFVVDVPFVGEALMSTDGTPAGTQPVDFVLSNPAATAPRALTATSSGVYFSGLTPTSGRDLYRTLLNNAFFYADIEPLKTPTDSNPHRLVRLFGQQLYLAASNSENAVQPYRYDKASGLVPIGDVAINPLLSSANGFTGLWDGQETRVFFTMAEIGAGVELFVYDTAGINKVSDVFPGTSSSNPRELTPFGGELYFVASPADDQNELFRTDGTEAGTVQVVPTNPLLAGDVSELTSGHAGLYFVRTNPLGARHAYRTDGQTVVQVSPPAALPTLAPPPRGLRFANGRLIYLTFPPLAGGEPRVVVYDEATEGLTEWSLPSTGHTWSADSPETPFEPLVHNGRYYFTVADVANPLRDRLFSIDPGTGEVRPHYASATSTGRIGQLTGAGEYVYFESSGQLLRCTAAPLTGQLVAATATLDEVAELTDVGDRLYFHAAEAADDSLEQELLRVGPFGPPGSSETFEAILGSGPGTPGPYGEQPQGLTLVGGDLYYSAELFAGPGRELYRLPKPEASVVDYDLPGSGGSLSVGTPNLGHAIQLEGFSAVPGGITAVVLGSPAAPYGLPGVVPTDAACIGAGNLQVVGVFGSTRWTSNQQVPPTLNLAGAQFTLQGIVADVLTPGAPLRLTNAKFLTLGL